MLHQDRRSFRKKNKKKPCRTHDADSRLRRDKASVAAPNLNESRPAAWCHFVVAPSPTQQIKSVASRQDVSYRSKTKKLSEKVTNTKLLGTIRPHFVSENENRPIASLTQRQSAVNWTRSHKWSGSHPTGWEKRGKSAKFHTWDSLFAAFAERWMTSSFTWHNVRCHVTAAEGRALYFRRLLFVCYFVFFFLFRTSCHSQSSRTGRKIGDLLTRLIFVQNVQPQRFVASVGCTSTRPKKKIVLCN